MATVTTRTVPRIALMPADRLVLRTPRRDLGEEVGQPEIAALGV